MPDRLQPRSKWTRLESLKPWGLGRGTERVCESQDEEHAGLWDKDSVCCAPTCAPGDGQLLRVPRMAQSVRMAYSDKGMWNGIVTVTPSFISGPFFSRSCVQETRASSAEENLSRSLPHFPPHQNLLIHAMPLTEDDYKCSPCVSMVTLTTPTWWKFKKCQLSVPPLLASASGPL